MLVYLLFCLGLVLLLVGGDFLVRGAVGLAERFGISPLIIGLTVVALGTSAPELFVSLQAALAGSGGLAVGNVVGSNIANVFWWLVFRRSFPVSRANSVHGSLFFLFGLTVIFMLQLWSVDLDGLLLLFLRPFWSSNSSSRRGKNLPTIIMMKLVLCLAPYYCCLLLA